MNLGYEIYIYAFTLLELAAAIVGCRLVKRYWSRPYKVLAALMVVTFCAEVGATVAYYNHTAPNVVYAWLTPVETWGFLYFLGMTQSRRLLKWVHVFLAVSMLVLQPIYLSLKLPFRNIFQDVYLQAYFNLLLLLVSCGALIEIIRKEDHQPMFHYPVFWTAAGIIAYSCCAIILNFTNFAMSLNLFMTLNSIANICMYSGVIVCFVKYGRQQRALRAG